MSATRFSWSTFTIAGLITGSLVVLLSGRGPFSAAVALTALPLMLLWFRRDRRRHAFMALWSSFVIAFVIVGLVVFRAAGALLGPTLLLLIVLFSAALLLGAVVQALLEQGLIRLRARRLARALSRALPNGRL